MATLDDPILEQTKHKMGRCWAGVLVARKKADSYLQGVNPDVVEAAKHLEAAKTLAEEATRLQEWVWVRERRARSLN